MIARSPIRASLKSSKSRSPTTYLGILTLLRRRSKRDGKRKGEARAKYHAWEQTLSELYSAFPTIYLPSIGLLLLLKLKAADPATVSPRYCVVPCRLAVSPALYFALVPQDAALFRLPRAYARHVQAQVQGCVPRPPLPEGKA